jgi:hypothetical protein
MSTSVAGYFKNCKGELYANKTGKLYRVLLDTFGKPVSVEHIGNVVIESDGLLLVDVEVGRYKVVMTDGVTFYFTVSTPIGNADLVHLIDPGPIYPKPENWYDLLKRTSF